MGKRSDFERRERDAYFTPLSAVIPLLPHLPEGARFYEPCVGDGALKRHLESHGHVCTGHSDIEPMMISSKINALELTEEDFRQSDLIITNPPWDRKILHPMIEHFIKFKPTWLLFDADWMHTKQSTELMKRCSKVVSVGRVKWIEDSKMTGKDNVCWYLFSNEAIGTTFYGR